MLTLMLGIGVVLAPLAAGGSKLVVEIDNLHTNEGVVGIVVFERAEGYGSSNNPAPRIGPPRFDDARFVVSVPQQAVSIRMVYP